MKYWDSSALLPQFVVEEGTAKSRQLLNEDDHVITWMWARAEIVSAIERRTREGSLAPDVRLNTLDWLARVEKDWYEITGRFRAVSVRKGPNIRQNRPPGER